MPLDSSNKTFCCLRHRKVAAKYPACKPRYLVTIKFTSYHTTCRYYLRNPQQSPVSKPITKRLVDQKTINQMYCWCNQHRTKEYGTPSPRILTTNNKIITSAHNVAGSFTRCGCCRFYQTNPLLLGASGEFGGPISGESIHLKLVLAQTREYRRNITTARLHLLQLAQIQLEIVPIV